MSRRRRPVEPGVVDVEVVPPRRPRMRAFDPDAARLGELYARDLAALQAAEAKARNGTASPAEATAAFNTRWRMTHGESQEH